MSSYFSLSDERGVAIIVVAMIMIVVAILGAILITQTSHDLQLVNRTQKDKQALFLAESAKERGYKEIWLDDRFTHMDEFDVSVPGTASDTLKGGSYDLVANTLAETEHEETKIVELVGTGDVGTKANKQVKVIAEVIRDNLCVWNNAIFGGSGSSGGVISGNCGIHGSVHLLGDNVGEGNSSIAAIDMSGTALIHNNYEDNQGGMPAELRAIIPELPQTDNGDYTLGAKLRVKNGAVSLTGTSEVGATEIEGNGLKESMDGIYIETDYESIRWTGDAVVDGVPNPANVESDNGTDTLYQYGDLVTFPVIEPGVTFVYDETEYTDYNTFYQPQSIILPTNSSGDFVFDGSADAANLVAAKQAEGFDFGANTTVEVNGDQFTITKIDPTDGTIMASVSYDPVDRTHASLSITGLVEVQGDVDVGTKNLNIQYTGSGTIYAAGDGSSGAAGDIWVHGDVLPTGAFPANSLGLVAKNDMYLAYPEGESQVMMAGAFYAGNTIYSRHQNHILGTFVSIQFDMGTDVPSIYQVPELIRHLPPGLPGSDDIWWVTGFDERSWQVTSVQSE